MEIHIILRSFFICVLYKNLTNIPIKLNSIPNNVTNFIQREIYNKRNFIAAVKSSTNKLMKAWKRFIVTYMAETSQIQRKPKNKKSRESFKFNVKH